MVTTERPDDKPQDIDADDWGSWTQCAFCGNSIPVEPWERADTNGFDRCDCSGAREGRYAAMLASLPSRPAPASFMGGPPQLALRELVDDLSGDAAVSRVFPLLTTNAPGRPPILYGEGKLNAIHGMPGTGKTWLALLAAKTALQHKAFGRPRVAYLDADDTRDGFQARAAALGMDLPMLQENIIRVGAGIFDPGQRQARRELVEWLAAADKLEASVAILDSLEKAGCPGDGSSVVEWYQEFVDPFLAAGVSVIVVDHEAADTGDGKGPRVRTQKGNGHKEARITGASLSVSGSAWTQALDGKIYVYNAKDRVGELPAPRGKCVAVIEGQHVGDRLALNVNAPIPKSERTADVGEVPTKILAALVSAGGNIRTWRTLREAVKGKLEQVKAAAATLEKGGMLTIVKDGRADVFSITEKGIESA